MFLHFPWICFVSWILRSSCDLKKKKKKGQCPRDILRITYEPQKTTRRFLCESYARGNFFPLHLKRAEGKGDAEGSIFNGIAFSCLPCSPSVGLFQRYPHSLNFAKCEKEWLSHSSVEERGACVETVTDLSSLFPLECLSHGRERAGYQSTYFSRQWIACIITFLQICLVEKNLPCWLFRIHCECILHFVFNLFQVLQLAVWLALYMSAWVNGFPLRSVWKSN